ncbi:kinase-like protein [Ceratobasidium sp. AG-I]|nr:kinase-like protein [Ceratobasidium sp. AG-I]
MSSPDIISITKTRLATPQIQAILTKFYGDAPKRLDVHEFTSGCYNAAYLLTTEHGQCVLKVAPRPSIKVLRYEDNILDAEIRVLNILSRTNAPIKTPKVLIFDQSCSIVEAPYAIIEYIPGENLDKVRKALAEDDSVVVDQTCGKHVRFVNNIVRDKSGDDRSDGPVSGFGLCAIDAPQYPTWREAFSAFLLNLLEDAKDAAVPDIPHDEIKSALETHAAIFDEVTEPRLVIWDMWDGNVLISFSNPDTKTGASISGTIDYERALWGDPLMETTFKLMQAPSTALLEAYGSYKPAEMTLNERLRRAFYDLHLSLIWVIEVTFRGLEELGHGGKDMQMWGRMGTKMSLETIKALGGGAP